MEILILLLVSMITFIVGGLAGYFFRDYSESFKKNEEHQKTLADLKERDKKREIEHNAQRVRDLEYTRSFDISLESTTGHSEVTVKIHGNAKSVVIDNSVQNDKNQFHYYTKTHDSSKVPVRFFVQHEGKEMEISNSLGPINNKYLKPKILQYVTAMQTIPYESIEQQRQNKMDII